MTEEAKQLRREYMAKAARDETDEQREHRRTLHREWQRAHRDKVKAYQEKYWEKKVTEKVID